MEDVNSANHSPIVISESLKKLIIYSLIMVLLGGSSGALGAYLFNKYGTMSSKKGISYATVNVKEKSDITEVANKAMPAVVSITGVAKTVNFFGQSSASETAGTGYIVSSDGLIVTNKHVVSSENAQYSVITDAGKSYPAEVKSVDPIFDIAILKISATGLPTVTLGSSDGLVAGQTAIAIGNALGQYQNSVTVGVVSGIGRVIQASDSTGTATESLDNVIQTDAAINSGNSGGPLLNLFGQVIGMNTAVDSQGQGIGFALPVDLVKSALESYKVKGKISRAMLGVRYVSLTKEIAAQNDISVSEGAYIYSSNTLSAVVSDSPAAAAGLKTADIITAVGSDKVTVQNSLVSLLAKYQPGDKVKLTYLRDGKSKTVEVTLSETR